MSILMICLVALLIWKFGSFAARFLGGLLIVLTIAGLSSDGPHFVAMNAPLAMATGFGLWMLGHWLFAFKHKVWRNSLALKLFSLPGLHLFAPIPTNHSSAQPEWE